MCFPLSVPNGTVIQITTACDGIGQELSGEGVPHSPSP